MAQIRVLLMAIQDTLGRFTKEKIHQQQRNIPMTDVLKPFTIPVALSMNGNANLPIPPPTPAVHLHLPPRLRQKQGMRTI